MILVRCVSEGKKVEPYVFYKHHRRCGIFKSSSKFDLMYLRWGFDEIELRSIREVKAICLKNWA